MIETSNGKWLLEIMNSIVEVYLNSLAKHELYYENYQMVSVMFAMLMNFQMDLENLRILNEIITEFDILVSQFV